MKQKFLDYYMDIAIRTAELSYGKRLKVGSIIVKDNRIISIGYNGGVEGDDNNLEYLLPDGTLKTKPSVIHSELNCVGKLAKNRESGHGAVMFVTTAPCMECSKVIYVAGISEVYYKDEYRETMGIEFLRKTGVKVVKHERN